MRLRKTPTTEELRRLDKEQQDRVAEGERQAILDAQAAQQKRWVDAAAQKDQEEREAEEKVETKRRRERQRAQKAEAAWLARRAELQERVSEAKTVLALASSNVNDELQKKHLVTSSAQAISLELGAEELVKRVQEALDRHEKTPR